MGADEYGRPIRAAPYPPNSPPNDQTLPPSNDGQVGDALSPRDHSSSVLTPAARDAGARAVAAMASIILNNGGDPKRALSDFLQSPEGQRLMRVPGAREAMMENYNVLTQFLSSVRR